MTPYEAFILYTALKSHFTTSYDFFKYNGKVNIPVDTFEKRRDKFFFHKLAKHRTPKEFLIANTIVANPRTWIGDLVNSTEAEENLKVWMKRVQSLGYTFEEDLKKLLTNLDDNLIIKDNQHPYLLKLFLRKKVSIETMIILNDLLGFFSHWNKKLKDDIMWSDIKILCEKYRPFITYDKKRMMMIARKVFTPEMEVA